MQSRLLTATNPRTVAPISAPAVMIRASVQTRTLSRTTWKSTRLCPRRPMMQRRTMATLAPSVHLRCHHRLHRPRLHSNNNNKIYSSNSNCRRLEFRSPERHRASSSRLPSRSFFRRIPPRTSERTAFSRRQPAPTRANTTLLVFTPARVPSVPAAARVKRISTARIYSARVRRRPPPRTRGLSRCDPSRSYHGTSMGRRPCLAATCREAARVPSPIPHQRQEQQQCSLHHQHRHRRRRRRCHYYRRRLRRTSSRRLNERCSDWRRAPNGRTTSCSGCIRYSFVCVCIALRVRTLYISGGITHNIFVLRTE